MIKQQASVINGATKLMGLIGESISYTLSPAIHNHSASILNVNAVYLPLGMSRGHVEPFLHTAWELGATGFNVTTPHKAHVASLVSGHNLPSVNTLYRGDKWWQVASTDGEGFALGLTRMGVALDHFKAIVFLGAGGVVSAILQYMVDSWRSGKLRRLPEIHVHARRPDHQSFLQAMLPASHQLRFSDLGCDALRLTLEQHCECLLVQATSAPNCGDDLSYLLPAASGFRGAYCDLVYGRPSAFYQAFSSRNLKVQDGKPMLIEQARLAQRLWWGQAASYEVIEAVLP